MAQRNTWQRERVREALADARGFVSAQTLHASLRDDNTGIGLATVYRALAGLAAAGDADSLQSPEARPSTAPAPRRATTITSSAATAG